MVVKGLNKNLQIFSYNQWVMFNIPFITSLPNLKDLFDTELVCGAHGISQQERMLSCVCEFCIRIYGTTSPCCHVFICYGAGSQCVSRFIL